MAESVSEDPVADVRGRRFEIMAENFDEVFWMFNEDFSDVLYVNDQAEQIYGVKAETLYERPLAFLDEIHPDDVQKVQEAMETMANGNRVSLEYRVNTEEDYNRWVTVQGVPILNQDGTVDKIIGSSRDITERKRAERKLQAEKDRLEKIVSLQESVAQLRFDLDGIMDLVVDSLIDLTNADGAVIELAEDDELVYRAGSGSLAGQTGLRLKISESLSGSCYRTGTKKHAPNVEEDDRVDADTIRDADFECGSMLIIPLEHAGTAFGVLKVISRETNAFEDSDETVLNLLARMVSASISQALQYEEKEKYLEQVLKMAHTDPLTGLDNRRELMTQLKSEIERFKRYSNPLSFGILDLDHFKVVNDEYGHQTGDEVLRTIGKILKANTRDNDTAGRYGGEEFAFVLPETHLEQAVPLAERVLEDIRNHEFEIEGNCFSITASLGLTEYQSGQSLDELIGEADQALYDAKSKGRNCFVTA